MFQSLPFLVAMAFRHLFASRVKTLIFGIIVFLGAALVVLIGSVTGTISDGMKRSIIGSVSGHLQVYSAKSKEDLQIWSMTGSASNLEPMEDFRVLKNTLLKVPNVEKVVPMGLGEAIVTSGNSVDLALEKLRTLVKAKQGLARPKPAPEEYASQKGYVRQLAEMLREDLKAGAAVGREGAGDPEEAVALSKATSGAFWTGFDKKPLDSLEFLENKIAPQAVDADILWIQYLGTNLDDFPKAFERFEIVDGAMVPPGKRGFLFAKFIYEENLKLKIARRLDKIHEGLTQRSRPIAGDDEFQRFVRENKSQVREITMQLDPLRRQKFTGLLQEKLNSTEKDPDKLLALFLDMDDGNFEARYKFFYGELVPLVNLYRIRVGDEFTIKAYAKSGYQQSLNVKVYGTFQFRGLEKSALSGSISMMDLNSFRDLYGYLTDERRKEIETMKKASGLVDVKRESAEEDLFGGGAVVSKAVSSKITEPETLKGAAGGQAQKDLQERVYTREEIEAGPVMNAAVILKDGSMSWKTQKEILAAGKEAGLDLKVAGWQQASGTVGQFVLFMSAVLAISVLIILIVAVVIMNNAMVMATLERVQEFGTLRAIGAGKRFILAMLLMEVAVLSTIFGVLGAAGGAVGVRILHWIGFGAKSDVQFFLFSGPRLLPVISTPSVVLALVLVGVISAISSLYPAWLAMSVPPRQAMASDE